MRDDKRENIALAIGFTSILLVILLTLFRSNLFRSAAPDSASTQSAADSKQNFPTINATDLQKLIAKNAENTILLDIRSFEDYAAEHIVDVVNIPLDEFPVGQRIDPKKQIILIGASKDDGNLQTAYNKLKDENHSDIKVLSGGMESWKALIGNTVTYGNPKSFVDQTKVSYTDPEKVNDAIKQNVPMYVLDVRSAQEFNKGHIAGAVNIPFEELEKRRSEIKVSKAVIVGSNELEEFQAGVQLFDMLLLQPFIVRGAMNQWQEKGFPVVIK